MCFRLGHLVVGHFTSLVMCTDPHAIFVVGMDLASAVGLLLFDVSLIDLP